MKRIVVLLFLLTLICLVTPLSALATTIPTVRVANLGNANDPLTGNLYGGVAYAYRIGTTEVTNAQYADFLNAKAASDPLALYNTSMGSDAHGGITQSGVSGSFTYAARTNMGEKPVNFVSWYDSIRFANWLNNGQGSNSTETGAYTILGNTATPSNGLSITRNVGATWFLTSENEWYKAAYYQPAAQGGDVDNYWLYPTRSNSTPTLATANSVGDIGNPGPNVANYNSGADWNSQDGNVTTVGSAGPSSQSFYGTSDQGGNVSEWNEAFFFGSFRCLRAGSFSISSDSLESSGRGFSSKPEFANVGFRVASVPEPSSIALLALGLLLLVARWRRSWRATGCRLAARLGTAVLLGLIAVASVTASAGNLYAAEFIRLGILPGTVGSWAEGVSDDGSVVVGATSLAGGSVNQAFRWTEAAGMVGLGTLPGRTFSRAGGNPEGDAVSGDGATVVGYSGSPTLPTEAFIYSAADGMQGLGGLVAPTAQNFSSSAASASFDGSVVVGVATNALGKSEAFRWTKSGGMIGLGNLSGGSSGAYDVSADGSIVVGGSGGGLYKPFIWSAATGMQGLGEVTGAATAISSNGKVIAGEGRVTPSSTEAFRWDEISGVVGLGWLPGTANNDPSNRGFVNGINGDGSIIVGSNWSSSLARRRGFIWTADAGMQDLQQLLIDEYGLASSLAGWSLRTTRSISANGQFIVGVGVNPAGADEGWLVRLESVPEPPTLILALCGVVGVVCLRGRHRQGPRPKPLVHPVPR